MPKSTLAALGLVAAFAPFAAAQITADDITYLNQYGTPTYYNATGGFVGYNYAGGLGKNNWIYDGSTLTTVGLSGSGFNRDDGYHNSQVLFGNSQGNIAGSTERFNGAQSNGSASWLYNGSSSIRLGLYGSQYTYDDGYQYTEINALNAQGQAIGYSRTKTNSTSGGYAAWLYDGTSNIRLGYYGSGYTNHLGVEYTEVQFLNDQGQAAGWSRRYSGSSSTGNIAWIYDNGTITRLGFTGGAYVSPSSWGIEASTVYAMNNQGQVVGTSQRWENNYSISKIAWIYQGGTTQAIGLTRPEHTAWTGEQTSIIEALNESGYVSGYSFRYSATPNYNSYNPSPDKGRDAWVYNGTSTVQVGLSGGIYTSATGQQYSTIHSMNARGDVAGTSSHYDTNTPGRSAWVYSNNINRRIGLFDSAHTRPGTGRQESDIVALNNQGQVIGHSQWYKTGFSSSGYYGQDAWFFDGQDTKQIGLTGYGYSTARSQHSEAERINEQGQVTGFSKRYIDPGNGELVLGQSAWFYDSQSDQTFDLTLSTSSYYDKAFSSVLYLGEDGIALGVYDYYGEQGLEGRRAFIFSLSDGLHDLADYELTTALQFSAEGTSQIVNYIQSNGLGHIIGTGTLENGSSSHYLWVPASQVPVPAAIWLFATAILSMVGGKRHS